MQERSEEGTPSVMTDVDSKELEEYEMVYKNPFVVYLRGAINSYLEGKSEGSGIMEAAVVSVEKDGTTSGLDSFDKEYYRSKFWVATIDNSIAGGKDIQIIFRDRPDKIFYAWVYKLNTESGIDEF